MVGVITQYVKNFIRARFGKDGVRVFAVVMAFLLQFAVLLVQSEMTGEKFLLAFVNSFFIALAAAGGESWTKRDMQNH